MSYFLISSLSSSTGRPVPGLDPGQLPRRSPLLAALNAVSAAGDDAVLLAPGPQGARPAAAGATALGTGVDAGRSAGGWRCWLKMVKVDGQGGQGITMMKV